MEGGRDSRVEQNNETKDLQEQILDNINSIIKEKDDIIQQLSEVIEKQDKQLEEFNMEEAYISEENFNKLEKQQKEFEEKIDQ